MNDKLTIFQFFLSKSEKTWWYCGWLGTLCQCATTRLRLRRFSPVFCLAGNVPGPCCDPNPVMAPVAERGWMFFGLLSGTMQPQLPSPFTFPSNPGRHLMVVQSVPMGRMALLWIGTGPSAVGWFWSRWHLQYNYRSWSKFCWTKILEGTRATSCQVPSSCQVHVSRGKYARDNHFHHGKN